MLRRIKRLCTHIQLALWLWFWRWKVTLKFVSSELNAASKIRYIKKKADPDRIKEELQALAATQESNSEDVSADKLRNDFERNIHRIMDTSIPHKMTSSRYSLSWFKCSLRRQTRTEQRLYNKTKKSGSLAHWNEFRAARKRLHKNLKSARESYISDFRGGRVAEWLGCWTSSPWSRVRIPL